MTRERGRSFEIDERPEVPWLSIVLGYGPMLPFAAGTAASWLLAGAARDASVLLTVLWAASILAFLAGVRRGLSFRTGGGPQVAQIVTMFCLYVMSLASLVAIALGCTIVAVPVVLVGFAAIMVLDPIAARRGQAPLFFARLRPPQMAIAVASLALLLAQVMLR